MTRIFAADLKTGDVILPPARELSLWMRRRVVEEGLPESALHITVTSVEQASPDKRGAWLIVRGEGGLLSTWAIKVRPETPWPIVGRNTGKPVRSAEQIELDTIREGSRVFDMGG